MPYPLETVTLPTANTKLALMREAYANIELVYRYESAVLKVCGDVLNASLETEEYTYLDENNVEQTGLRSVVPDFIVRLVRKIIDDDAFKTKVAKNALASTINQGILPLEIEVDPTQISDGTILAVITGLVNTAPFLEKLYG